MGRDKTIVNVASISTLAHEWLSGLFKASGASVLTLSQSWRHEFVDRGMRMQVVLRGVVTTGAPGISSVRAARFSEETMMSADDMEDAALAGLDPGELETIPSLPDLNEPAL